MFIKDFTVLTEYRLAAPALKLAIQAGRFHLDDGTHFYEVTYDPDMDADHLWQRMPDEEIQRRIKFKLGRPKADQVPFVSDKESNILSFSIKETPNEDEVVLSFVGDEIEFFKMKRFVEDSKVPGISNNPIVFIENIIDVIFDWYSLKEFSPTAFKGIRNISFQIEKSFVRYLPRLTCDYDLDSTQRFFVLGRREIV